MGKEIFLSILALLILLYTPKILFSTQHTNWNTFYERHVKETFYSGNVPRFDNLSYLGRYMSYTPGYFCAKASFLYLFGLGYNYTSDILFELFLNISFIFSLIFLLKEIKLKEYKIALFILLFTSSLFLFTILAAHLMHTLAISLTTFSIVFSIRSLKRKYNKNTKKNILLSGIVLSAACLVHPFSLIYYTIVIIGVVIDSIRNFEDIKRIINVIFPVILISTSLFLVFYSRVLISLGYPYEALAKEWGWLRHWGIFSIIGEFFFITPVILFSLFLGIRNKNNIKLVALIIVLIIIYSFLSFRVNILIAFLVSLLVCRVIKNKKIIHLLIIIAFINSLFLIYRLGNHFTPCIDSGYLSQECLTAILYLKTIEKDKVINDPIISHPITFIAEKKVLSDLFVEYADEKKLLDSLEFARTGNLDIAKKWGIELALTRFDCKNYSKLYDNSYYKICDLTD